MKTIQVWEAKEIREKDACGEIGYINHMPRFIEYGEVEVLPGTGRARCRVCGKKISKAETAIKFEWDFTGCGSWTLTTCQIHKKPC